MKEFRPNPSEIGLDNTQRNRTLVDAFLNYSSIGVYNDQGDVLETTQALSRYTGHEVRDIQLDKVKTDEDLLKMAGFSSIEDLDDYYHKLRDELLSDQFPQLKKGRPTIVLHNMDTFMLSQPESFETGGTLSQAYQILYTLCQSGSNFWITFNATSDEYYPEIDTSDNSKEAYLRYRNSVGIKLEQLGYHSQSIQLMTNHLIAETALFIA